MKGRYITTQILLACLSKKQNTSKDIHSQLKETIVEHRRIMQQFISQIPTTPSSIGVPEREAA